MSESRWQTDEFPINPEFFREVSRQGFDAESFSGVMTSEQKKRLMLSSSAEIAAQCGAAPVMKVIRRARASSPIFGRSHWRTKNRVRRFAKAKTLQRK